MVILYVYFGNMLTLASCVGLYMFVKGRKLKKLKRGVKH